MLDVIASNKKDTWTIRQLPNYNSFIVFTYSLFAYEDTPRWCSNLSVDVQTPTYPLATMIYIIHSKSENHIWTVLSYEREVINCLRRIKTFKVMVPSTLRVKYIIFSPNKSCGVSIYKFYTLFVLLQFVILLFYKCSFV